VLSASGELAQLRAEQQRTWMWSLIRERLETRFRQHPAVIAALARLEAAVQAGATTSTAAADELLAAFDAGTPVG
jgi:LAO/AO transport system kinase